MRAFSAHRTRKIYFYFSHLSYSQFAAPKDFSPSTFSAASATGCSPLLIFQSAGSCNCSSASACSAVTTFFYFFLFHSSASFYSLSLKGKAEQTSIKFPACFSIIFSVPILLSHHIYSTPVGFQFHGNFPSRQTCPSEILSLPLASFWNF